SHRCPAPADPSLPHVSRARAPDVAVIDVVIVGHADGWGVPHKIAETPSKQKPLAQVVEAGAVQRKTLDAITGHAFVNLVAFKCGEVGFGPLDGSEQVAVRETVVVQ